MESYFGGNGGVARQASQDVEPYTDQLVALCQWQGCYSPLSKGVNR